MRCGGGLHRCYSEISAAPSYVPYLPTLDVILQSHDAICHRKKLNIEGGITTIVTIIRNAFNNNRLLKLFKKKKFLVVVYRTTGSIA